MKRALAKANVCLAAAPALRTPLSIAGSYASPFAMMGHHEMNGSLTSPSVYPGLISPQMSAAAAAAYGRSPIVSHLRAGEASPFCFSHAQAEMCEHQNKPNKTAKVRLWRLFESFYWISATCRQRSGRTRILNARPTALYAFKTACLFGCNFTCI